MKEEERHDWGCLVVLVVVIICYTAYECAKLTMGVK